MPATEIVWILHLAATLYMTGLIWFVQVVHYPLFGQVGDGTYSTYQRAHMERTTWVVLPPMLVELAASVYLAVVDRPASIPTEEAWIGLTLLVLIWISTFLVQVPLHNRLATAFDERVHRSLVRTNWARTLLWTSRSLLTLLWLVAA